MDPEAFIGIGYSGPHRSEGAETQWMAPHACDVIQERSFQRSESSSVGNAAKPPVADLSEARARALAVIQGFSKASEDEARVSKILMPQASVLAVDFRQKRLECLQKLEQRKRLAMLKNLDYVAKRQSEQLQQTLAQMKEAEAQEYALSLHQQKRKKKLQAQLSSQSGIGTDERQKVERKRQRTQHQGNDSVSLYVAGIPMDQTSSLASLESLLRSLFSSHGTIRKVHVYMDRSTGTPKGDALIIYHTGKDQSPDAAGICSQTNGIEFPCGSVLRVEPSDPAYMFKKNIKAEDGISESTPPINAETKSSDLDSSSAIAQNAEPEDNLDDFFSSLE